MSQDTRFRAVRFMGRHLAIANMTNVTFGSLANPFSPQGVSGIMPYVLPLNNVSGTATPGNNPAAITLTVPQNAGLNILSASQGLLTVVMPDVTQCAGAVFILRQSDAVAHVITGSAAQALVAGAGVRLDYVFSPGPTGQYSTAISGSAGRITFPGKVNSSIVMISDGISYNVIGGSGSFTYTQP